MINAIDKRITLILTWLGPVASLAISPSWNYDPINLIKLVFICSGAFYCLALMFTNLKITLSRISKITWIAASAFFSFMLSTLLFSGAPINQQIWGSFGRNTGFLTYFSLLVLLIAAAFIQTQDFHKKIVNSLVLVSIPMTAYCLIQVAELDPIGWSEKHPFGTLGNINFSSAFFGLSTICALALIGDKSYTLALRLSLIILIVIDLSIVFSTNSIQGLMMFVAGAGIQGYIFINRKFNFSVLNIFYILLGFLTTFVTLLGLSNKGPLASFLYAPSIIFRTDYWHAGWAMTLKFPIFGVGLDSYGDWYREMRGQISTVRTGPDRISNTAHNIFLDLSSNGGFPLLLSYLFLLLIAFKIGYSSLKQDPSPHKIALLTAWIGYIIFSSISIAQVGVNIWGWLFTGTIIGLNNNKKKLNSDNVQNTKRKVKVFRKVSNKQLSPTQGLIGIMGLFLGFALSIIPMQADAKFKSALQTKALDKMIASLENIGITSFHYEIVIDAASRNNFQQQTYDVAQKVVMKFPREFLGWKALYYDPVSPADVKSKAKAKVKELDPFNPEFK